MLLLHIAVLLRYVWVFLSHSALSYSVGSVRSMMVALFAICQKSVVSFYVFVLLQVFVPYNISSLPLYCFKQEFSTLFGELFNVVSKVHNSSSVYK